MEIENQEQEIQMSPELYLGVISLVTSVNGQVGEVVLTASDVNALSDDTLYAAALSLTINPTTYVLTGQLLDQNGDNLGEAQSIDLPLESMIVSGSYDATTKSVILTLKNGETITFSVADLVSGLQTEITQSNKLASDLVDDTNQTNKFITQVLLNKLNDYFIANATVTETGSNITLNNTLEAKINNVELYGDTVQNIYTGKNLMPVASYDTNDSRIVYSPNLTLTAGTYTASFDLDNYTMGTNTSFDLRLTVRDENNTGHNIALQTITSSTTTGHKTVTFTISYNVVQSNNNGIFITTAAYDAGGKVKISNLQIEAGSTATDFEPYTGGIPAPNPDYPQDIHVVTGEQTVKVSGKNLIVFPNSTHIDSGVTWTFADDTITGTGTATSRYVRMTVNETFDNPLPIGTYTFSIPQALEQIIQIVLHESGGTTRSYNIAAGNTSVSFTTDFIATQYHLVYRANDTEVNLSMPNRLQLEASSTATAYQPYQSQSYTIDLGSFELCKIGDYQDYIYKNGDDWYLHKAIGKIVLNGRETWAYNSSAAVFYVGDLIDYATDGTTPLATYYTGQSNVSAYMQLNNNSIALLKSSTNNRLVIKDTTMSNTATFTTWLENNNVMLYYALATPSDTQITDTTLIGQLDELTNIKSYLGTTNIIVTATDTNLPAPLKISIYLNSLAGNNQILINKQDKLIAGDNITIEGNIISATGGGSITPIQTTGTSTTDVMSQNAVSTMVFNDPGTDMQIKIGADASNPGTRGIVIGNGAYNAVATGISDNMSIGVGAHSVGQYDGIAIGRLASTTAHSSIAIGRGATVGSVNYRGSIAFGAYSAVTRTGEINVGTSWGVTGFNNTNYRVIGGVHDGQLAQDVATVNQVNATIDAINTALNTSIPHIGSA